MQHIASRESLVATNNHLLTVADPLDDAELDALGRELAAVADMLLVAGAAAPHPVGGDAVGRDVRANIADRAAVRQGRRAGAVGRGFRGPSALVVLA